MIKEIGSEFWDVPVTDKENGVFPKETQWFISGRSALKAIIKELEGVHTIAMPSWCCDSMIKPFIDAGMEVCFYPVYYKDGLVQEPRLDCDVLLLMDYFGYTQPQMNLSQYMGVVIRDVTHSIFSATYSDADYYFGSLRKWCGVWTGGYACSKDGRLFKTEQSTDCKYIALRKEAMHQKAQYINNHVICDKAYLGVFVEAEEILEDAVVLPAAEEDVLKAHKLDVELIKSRRRENAEILRTAFRDWLMFSALNDMDCPMFVPILVPDNRRNELRQFLINNEIYCPIHWPVSQYHTLKQDERFIYDNELSLVCDQRYTAEDMYRVVDAIERFFKEG